jgi:hypothetical protein
LTPVALDREDNPVADTVHCDTHGETEQTFVCIHLTGESAGLGFNTENLTEEDPFPDAWCDNCEIIRAAHDGWTNESQKLTRIVLLCSGCYERVRIRNTRPSVTLDDLATLRWKCGSCDEWHSGPALDFGFSEPYYWSNNFEQSARWTFLSSGSIDNTSKTFLDEDYCAIDEDFFVRGVIHLPIVGTTETFRWGVWGSLSRQNFETLLKADQNGDRIDLPPMFSWLSNQISDYPDTLSLKMYAHIQKPGLRPHFELQPSDHPLAQEFLRGITPGRVKEIMGCRMPS